MPKTLTKFWKFLSSRNVAIVLLLIVTGMLLLAELLPNPNFMQESEIIKLRDESPLIYFLANRFNTQIIAGGYVFGILSIFLIISTTACSIDRLIEKRNLKRIPINEVPVREYDISMKIEDGEGTLQRVKKSLRMKRWNLREMKDGKRTIIAADKGGMGFIGSVFFHAILITVLFGAAYYYFTGFHGTLLFTEGQSKTLREESFESIEKKPLFGLQLPHMRFRLDHFYALFWKDREPVDYTAKFLIEDLEEGTTWDQTIKINQPLRYGSLDFLMVIYGFSPNFVIYKDGSKIFDAYVVLSVMYGREDRFQLKDEDLNIRCRFYPDFKENSEGFYTESPQPKNPVFFLRISKKGRYIFEGLLPLGGEVIAGEYKVKFNDLRYWITLDLVKEAGIGFLFWCSILGLAGLMVRFLDPDRRILMNHESGVLSVVSYSRHFEGILKEQTAELINSIVAKGEEK